MSVKDAWARLKAKRGLQGHGMRGLRRRHPIEQVGAVGRRWLEARQRFLAREYAKCASSTIHTNPAGTSVRITSMDGHECWITRLAVPFTHHRVIHNYWLTEGFDVHHKVKRSTEPRLREDLDNLEIWRRDGHEQQHPELHPQRSKGRRHDGSVR